MLTFGRLLPLAAIAGLGLVAGCTTYVQPPGYTYVPVACPAGVVNGQVLAPAPPVPAPDASSSTTTTTQNGATSSSTTTITAAPVPQQGDAPIIANAPPNTCYAVAPLDPAYSGWPYRYGYYAGYGAYPYPYYADPYPYPGVWVGGVWRWHHRH